MSGHIPRSKQAHFALAFSLLILAMGLTLGGCSRHPESSPRPTPPIEWRLVPETTVLGDRRQFFIYGRKLDSVRVEAPAGVEVERGPVKSDGRVLSLYLKVDPWPADSTLLGKKPGSREIRVMSSDTLVTFSLKIVDEIP